MTFMGFSRTSPLITPAGSPDSPSALVPARSVVATKPGAA